MQGSENETTTTITLPERSLLVLCGPAGSGKSTFARKFIEAHTAQGLKETMIVSSDVCRAMVSDNESNQQANRDSFDLFHYIIHKRMFQNRFTIADSTALLSEARNRMLALAQRHNYSTCLLVFNIPTPICLERDQGRDRKVWEQVITYHANALQKALEAIPQESWQQVRILNEHDLERGLEIVLNS